MYSSLLATVNGAILAGALLTAAGPMLQPLTGGPFDSTGCDPRLLTLFAPPHPQLGRYEICARPEALEQLKPREWTAEPMAPLDALGSAGAYDRAKVARLYGGTRPTVARGWIQSNGTFLSVTLVSPYPDFSQRHLEPGTLIIRFIICCS